MNYTILIKPYFLLEMSKCPPSSNKLLYFIIKKMNPVDNTFYFSKDKKEEFAKLNDLTIITAGEIMKKLADIGIIKRVNGNGLYTLNDKLITIDRNGNKFQEYA